MPSTNLFCFQASLSLPAPTKSPKLLPPVDKISDHCQKQRTHLLVCCSLYQHSFLYPSTFLQIQNHHSTTSARQTTVPAGPHLPPVTPPNIPVASPAANHLPEKLHLTEASRSKTNFPLNHLELWLNHFPIPFPAPLPEPLPDHPAAHMYLPPAKRKGGYGLASHVSAEPPYRLPK